jgi:putative ABC transport system permease protein
MTVSGWIVGPLSGLSRDLRIGARLLAKERWFTSAAVVALALGMAAVVMMLTIIDGYYFRGLSTGQPGRVLYVGNRDIGGRTRGLSYAQYQELTRSSRTLAPIGGFAGATMTVQSDGLSPETVGGAYLSATVFDILRVAPIVGRSFLPSDDRVGAPPVALLGHRLWTMRYGADPAIVGRTVTINGMPSTVVGVMPADFEFPYRETVWQPLALMPGLERNERTIGVFGRLAAGNTAAQATTELRGLAAAAESWRGDPDARTAPFTMRFGQQQTGRLGDDPPPLMLIATALFVLLIACVNVANLLLARSVGRASEIAIRLAVGATRWHIVRQLVVESAMLALLAGAAGLWFSRLGVQFIADAFGRNVPYWMRFTVDGRIIAAVLLLSLLTTLAFGLAPAIAAARNSPISANKLTGRGPRSRRWTSVLLAGQLAVTLTVMAGACLMVRSYLSLYSSDGIVDASRLLTAQMSLGSLSPLPMYRVRFYQALDERLGAVAGLPLATIASSRPFVGTQSRALSLDGAAATMGAQLPSVSVVAIGPRYFETLGVRLQRGRTFTARDGTPGNETVIVNQRFAERHFQGRDPIGQRLRLLEPDGDQAAAPWLTVIGVAPAIRQRIAAAARPAVYVPIRTYTGNEAALIAGGVDRPASLAPILRRVVATLDPGVTVYNLRPLEELRSDSRLQHRLIGTVLAAFAAIALLLSAIGLYGLTAYAVVQRRHEIGVRAALGASPGAITRLFVRRALVPLAAGAPFAALGALGAGQLLRGLLIDTSPTDMPTLLLISGSLVGVALTASFLPSRRAARVDPAVVLRQQP